MRRSGFSISRIGWIRFSILFILVTTIWSASNIMWGSHAGTIIKADGKGYYAHLPALFIYGDLNFGFFDRVEDEYGNENLYYDYRKFSEGNVYNKYFAGTALCMLPGFVVGHIVTQFTNLPADGYSKWYQISVSWSAICFTLLTLVLFWQILAKLGIRSEIIAFVLPVMYFGSNWYYYVLAEPAMSHVYSIFLISALFYCALMWAENGQKKWIWLQFALIGLITFIRPLNAVAILLVPAAFPNFQSFKLRFVESIKVPSNLLAPVFALAIVCLQLIIYKIQTGNFLIYSYEEEGFNFLSPHMLDILFSYKKGLFLYTPILLLALFGYVTMSKTQTFRAFVLSGFFLLLTYLLSSWWNWYYGGSFSSRAYIEYYLIFLLPLAHLLNNLKSKIWLNSFKAVLVLLVLFCQFQTYQYRYMVIHWDAMTKEKYWDAFLNTDFLR